MCGSMCGPVCRAMITIVTNAIIRRCAPLTTTGFQLNYAQCVEDLVAIRNRNGSQPKLYFVDVILMENIFRVISGARYRFDVSREVEGS